MLAYSPNYSPFVEAGPFILDTTESTEFVSPVDSPPAMTHGSPSVKSELPQLSPAQIPTSRQLSDSGLGIIIQEDVYGHAFHLTTEQENASIFLPSGYVSSHDHRKLASPFEEQMRAPVPLWNYPPTTLSNFNTSNYTTPEQNQFLSPQMAYPNVHYSTSPASYTPSMLQHIPVPSDTHSRHVGQHSSSVHSAPAQMSQWLPQQSMNYQSYPTPMFTQPSAFSMSQCQDQWCNQTCSPHQAVTVPARRKPHLRPSLSESSVMRVSSPTRYRAATTENFLQPPQYDLRQQLPLPPLPQNMLVHTSPDMVLSDPPRYTHRLNRSTSGTPHRRRRPSSPPAIDFMSTKAPYLMPVRQEPAFQGDLYTPKYKRRTQNGRWEGWCGYCQPGRWLDLKNSRYWEDKLRNHGICAKTKMKFEEPIEIRRVNPDGAIVVKTDFENDLADPFSDQKKREGLCGTCGIWVAMDGLRTKARDRAVGWWMHAYKCHDHDKTQEQPSSSSYAEQPQEPGSEG